MASAWAAGPPKGALASGAPSGDWALGAGVKLTTLDGEALSGEARGAQRAGCSNTAARLRPGRDTALAQLPAAERAAGAPLRCHRARTAWPAAKHRPAPLAARSAAACRALTHASMLPQVFAFDKATETLVLRAPGAAGGESTLHIVAVAAIKARSSRLRSASTERMAP